MKYPNQTILKHALFATFVTIALNGCDGEDAKPREEAIAPSKVAEAPVVTPAPVARESVNPTVPPVAETPVAPPPKPDIVLSNDKSGLVNIAKGKVAKQSGDHDATSKSDLAVDGNVDGDFGHGSVTHTAVNPDAWLDIDLGNSEKLDHIVLWNRTDCCGDRLQNYWIFISDKPFSATDTVERLKKSKGVKAIRGGVANPSFSTAAALGEGRYVRIQFDGGTGRPAQAGYLSLAEVEVYRAK